MHTPEQIEKWAREAGFMLMLYDSHMTELTRFAALVAQHERERASKEGDVVITTDKSGRCVLVSRQDEEGRILKVIWEAA